MKNSCSSGLVGVKHITVMQAMQPKATSSYELKIQSTLPYILYSHIIMYMCFSSNSSIFDLIAHIINYQYFFSHSQGGKFASFQIYLIA